MLFLACRERVLVFLLSFRKLRERHFPLAFEFAELALEVFAQAFDLPGVLETERFGLLAVGAQKRFHMALMLLSARFERRLVRLVRLG